MLAAWRSGGFAGNLEGFTDTEPGGEVPGLGALKFLGGQEGQPRGMGPAPSALITGTWPLCYCLSVRSHLLHSRHLSRLSFSLWIKLEWLRFPCSSIPGGLVLLGLSPGVSLCEGLRTRQTRGPHVWSHKAMTVLALTPSLQPKAKREWKEAESSGCLNSG